MSPMTSLKMSFPWALLCLAACPAAGRAGRTGGGSGTSVQDPPPVVCVCAVANGPASVQSPHPPVLQISLVDESDPIRDGATKQRWREQFCAELCRLQPGDATLMLPINERSEGAAPLYQARIPTAGPRGPLLARVAARKALLRIRNEAAVTFDQALASAEPAKRTDLLGALDRVARAATESDGRNIELLVFSDFLNATPELNLERTRITSNVDRLIDRVAAARGWDGSALRGTRVRGYLTASAPALPGVVHPGMQLLEKFWKPLFATKLGAQLERFDNTNLAL